MAKEIGSSRNVYVLYLAVFVLFVHAIIQQRIISTIRAEIELNLHSKRERSVKSSDADYYLKTRSPPNMPSVILSEDEELNAKKVRDIYGGKKDALHLGGFTEIDPMGISENLWNFMLGPLAIKSIVDVGCGRGHSTSYFKQNGANVLCVEGSHDAVTQSLLSPEDIVEHDFSRGPWWPEKTYDAVWSVEFLEHVARPYMKNYLPIFKKCALLFVTSSAWGGWHHVEVHEEWWWRGRMAAQGFVYSEELTTLARLQAQNGISLHAHEMRGDSENFKEHKFHAQHIWTRMLVFINPTVASLPEHHHIFGGDGCFNNIVDNRDGGLPCGLRQAYDAKGIGPGDKLPGRYQSILKCVRSTQKMSDKGDWAHAIWECVGNQATSQGMLRMR